MPSFEDVTKDFWARGLDEAMADLDEAMTEHRAVFSALQLKRAHGSAGLAALQKLADDLHRKYVLEDDDERPHLTLIEGGMSPIGDTGGDDVAC